VKQIVGEGIENVLVNMVFEKKLQKDKRLEKTLFHAWEWA
jgi:hypothetical protein